jgi:thiol-disulfide isomerase/thioredoxin
LRATSYFAVNCSFRPMLDPTNSDSARRSPHAGATRHRFVAAALRWITVAALALLAIQIGCSEPDSGTHSPGIGHQLPQLRLEPLTGDSKPIDLKDLTGHVVLLDFWGTWCPPCQDEFPHIAAIAAKYRDRSDFLCLPVSCDGEAEKHDELRNETGAFLQSYKLDLATYWDPGSYSRLGIDMVAEFSAYPTTIVLDRHGVIRGFWIGYSRGDEREIEKCVIQWLDKPDSPADRHQDDSAKSAK